MMRRKNMKKAKSTRSTRNTRNPKDMMKNMKTMKVMKMKYIFFHSRIASSLLASFSCYYWIKDYFSTLLKIKGGNRRKEENKIILS